MSLHLEACEPALYKLLQEIMAIPSLKGFYLAGDTAIALYLGHRKSYDLDLFTNDSFNSMELLTVLEKTFIIDRAVHSHNTIRCFIGDSKVEFFTHEYDSIEEITLQAGVRIAGVKELAAMKLNAVAGRGSKKDFWDIAALLDIFPMSEMMSYFQAKYPSADVWHLIKSLSYFDDAEDEQVNIIDLQSTSWKQVKNKVLEALASISP